VKRAASRRARRRSTRRRSAGAPPSTSRTACRQLAPLWTDDLQGRLLMPRARRVSGAVQNANS
jgi:hypothetical protein